MQCRSNASVAFSSQIKSDDARVIYLSKIMVAAATLRHRLPNFCGAVSKDEVLHEKLLNGYPEDLANIVFSMAKMR